MIKIILAAALAVTAVAPPAAAQYYGGGYGGGGYYGDGYSYRRSYRDYDEPPRRRYREERYDRYDRRDFDDGYGRRGDNRGGRFQQQTPAPGRGGGGGFANTCVTPRGPCQSPAQPAGSSCICFVPGVGNTPGTMR